MSEITQPQAPAKRRTPGWLPIVIGLLSFLLVLTTLGTAVVDWFSRNVELDRLVTAIERSEDAMGWTQEHLGFVYEESEGSGELNAEQQAERDAALRVVVGEGRERIAAAGVDVQKVQILPWHDDIVEAQSAYVRHNEAWQEYMWRAERDLSQLTTEQPEVNDSFIAVEAPLRDALPDLALYNLEQRVTDIFVEGMPDEEPQPDGPTQEAGLLPGVR